MTSEIRWAATVVAGCALLSVATSDWSWMDIAWGYTIVRGCILAARC